MCYKAMVLCVTAIAVLAMGGTANAAMVTWGLVQ